MKRVFALLSFGIFFFCSQVTSAQASLCNDSRVLPIVRARCQAAEKSGNRALSCYRSAAKQAALRAYYIKRGRPGQAAKKSMHTKGAACDVARRDNRTLSPLKLLQLRGHTGNHYSTNGH